MKLLRLYRIWKRDRITPKRPRKEGLTAETVARLLAVSNARDMNRKNPA